MKLKVGKWMWHKVYRTNCFILRIIDKKKVLVQISGMESAEIVLTKCIRKLKTLPKQKRLAL